MMVMNMENECDIVRLDGVRIAGMKARLTCPLCNDLFKEATGNTECIHTFCRKCIYDKITDDKLQCCPICNIDWGETPLETLREDTNLQKIRNVIFPSNGRKEKAPEVVPSVPLPAERKEF